MSSSRAIGLKKILSIKLHDNLYTDKPSRSMWGVMMKPTVALRFFADKPKNETSNVPHHSSDIINSQHNPSEITILMRKRKWLFVSSCEYERPISTET